MTYDLEWYRKQVLGLMSESELSLAKIYQQTAKNIKSELAGLYEKYSQSGSLTYAEMSKGNRLNNLFTSINDELKASYKGINGEVKGLVGDVFSESYYMNGFMISKDVGLNLSFGVIPTDMIKSLWSEPTVSGLSIFDTLKKYEYNSILKIRQEITQGFIQGDSYVDMAKRISDATDISFNDGLRILRTEGGRASSEGQLALFDDAKDMGIEMTTMWVATLDDKTRPSHQELDGKLADEDGLFWIDGMSAPAPRMFGDPAEDINCRCDVIANVNGEKPSVRRENIGDKDIIDYKTYKEWRADQE
jgi:SPP1 gp7 family putative phage head morphogenesis protein